MISNNNFSSKTAIFGLKLRNFRAGKCNLLKGRLSIWNQCPDGKIGVEILNLTLN